MVLNGFPQGGSGSSVETVTVDLTSNNGCQIYGYAPMIDGPSTYVFSSGTGDASDVVANGTGSITVPKGSLVFVYSKTSWDYPSLTGGVDKLAQYHGVSDNNSSCLNGVLYYVDGAAALSVYIS